MIDPIGMVDIHRQGCPGCANDSAVPTLLPFSLTRVVALNHQHAVWSPAHSAGLSRCPPSVAHLDLRHAHTSHTMPPAHPTTALPTFYYVVFGLYEPLLTSLGFIGALFDPKTVSDPHVALVQAIT